MKEKQGDAQKFISFTNKLPECCQGYLLTGLSENTLTTKIAYARDILYFMEFSINYYPYYSDKTVKEITFDDLAKITAEDINVYLFHMKDSGLGEKSRARKKSAISAMFNYMINAQRKLNYNPVAGSTKIRLPEKDFVIYLTMEEQERMLNTVQTGYKKVKKILYFPHLKGFLSNPENTGRQVVLSIIKKTKRRTSHVLLLKICC